MLLYCINLLDDLCDALLRFLDNNSRLRLIVIMTLAFLLFSAGTTTLPPIDRDEARFAQATKQMLEDNQYLDIEFQQEKRYKKPIGIYWMQAASAKLSGLSENAPIWVYRLPSILGALLTVFAGIALIRRLYGRQAGVIGGLLLPLPILLSVEAHLAKTDAVLTGCITVGLYCLAKLWVSDKKEKFQARHFWFFWLSLALGILVKGLNVPLIAAIIVTLSVVRRDISWLSPLRPIWGLLITIALTMPWFLFIANYAGNDFIRQSITGDFWQKILSVQESHGGIPGTYLLTHYVTFWPLSLLIIPALIRAWLRRYKDRESVFCLSCILPFWIVLEFVPTKLPHYILPVLVPIIALVTAWLQALRRDIHTVSIRRALLLQYAIYGLTSLLLIGAGGIALSMLGNGIHIIDIMIMALVLSLVALSLYAAWQHLSALLIMTIALTGISFTAWAYHSVFPRLEKLHLTPRLAKTIEAQKNCQDPEIALVGYSEPSSVFLLGTNTKFLPVDQAASFFANDRTCRVLIIEQKYQKDWSTSLKQQEIHLEPQLLDTIDGFNIGKGRYVTLFVYSNY